MPRLRAPWVALGVVLAGGVVPGRAAAGTLSDDAEFKVRLVLPFAATEFGLGPDEGFVASLLGVTVGLELFRLVVVEVGAALALHSSWRLGPNVDVRLGVAVPFADTLDPEGRGWIFQADLLAGYRYANFSIDHEYTPEHNEFHGVTGSLGLDFTFWFSDELGLTTRAMATFTGVVQQEFYGAWTHMYHPEGPEGLDAMKEDWFVGYDLSFGLAF